MEIWDLNPEDGIALAEGLCDVGGIILAEGVRDWGWRGEPLLTYVIFKNPVRTSKITPHFTITRINWLTLFKFNPLKTKLV
jgi:hypothetical protein